ncbi:MAG TPA: 3-hydroxybutyrate dehydrogenase [Jatrophihabitans sp.]|jgi:3-hydroxybutyrate dehydrogenase|uniref:3-hydroxybutyrate dehydrogenase n=1 Tax=Jatrophihabitans sp. TaxID=1932789 RepID=UPI002EEFEA4F
MNHSAGELKGRRALVSGGAAGIGAACARGLARAGADVIVLDRDAEGAKALAAEIGAQTLVADLSDAAEIAALAVDVDILVNNAGVQHVAAIPDFPPETFDRLLRLMLHAPFLLARAALPAMYERGWGRIINISSVHGHRASPYKSAYVAAKHGLEGLSKVIALESGEHGVTSNCIAPGYVRTALVEGQIAAQAATRHIPAEDVVERLMLSESVVKRLIEPEEVAAVAVFLCTPAASYITGASIAVDGGWTAR